MTDSCVRSLYPLSDTIKMSVNRRSAPPRTHEPLGEKKVVLETNYRKSWMATRLFQTFLTPFCGKRSRGLGCWLLQNALTTRPSHMIQVNQSISRSQSAYLTFRDVIRSRRGSREVAVMEDWSGGNADTSSHSAVCTFTTNVLHQTSILPPSIPCLYTL